MTHLYSPPAPHPLHTFTHLPHRIRYTPLLTPTAYLPSAPSLRTPRAPSTGYQAACCCTSRWCSWWRRTWAASRQGGPTPPHGWGALRRCAVARRACACWPCGRSGRALPSCTAHPLYGTGWCGRSGCAVPSCTAHPLYGTGWCGRSGCAVPSCTAHPLYGTGWCGRSGCAVPSCTAHPLDGTGRMGPHCFRSTPVRQCGIESC